MRVWWWWWWVAPAHHQPLRVHGALPTCTARVHRPGPQGTEELSSSNKERVRQAAERVSDMHAR
jgi:hypothetical protein